MSARFREIDGVDLCGVDENAALAIGDDGAGLPRGPKPFADLDIFFGHVITLVVLRQLLHAEILRRQVGTARDHVPAAAAGRNLIERADDPRGEIRRVGEGRQGWNDAEARRRGRHQRGHHGRLLARNGHAVLQKDVA
jgi:hypothetical protein